MLTSKEEVVMGLEKICIIYGTHTCMYTDVIVFLWDTEMVLFTRLSQSHTNTTGVFSARTALLLYQIQSQYPEYVSP